ncbi:MAG: S41 family peptidase [Elusimicrobiota bacterium]
MRKWGQRIVLGGLFFSFTLGITGIFFAQTKTGESVYQEIKLLIDVMNLIEEHYVEPVETKKLIYGAASGMVQTLDPFSQFMPPDLHKEMKTETDGVFGGLGIRISLRDDMLTVITPLPGTPAYRVGILPGDKIIKIEGVSTKGITINDAVKKMRGAPGTKVTVTVFRESEKEPRDFTIIRELIKIESIKSKMLTEEIGYVRIVEFTAKTNQDLDAALTELKSKGMKKLVLDLRNNPGGLLTIAVDVCREFLGGNKLIVYTQGRNAGQKQEFRAGPKGAFEDIPLVILVNKGSASGSEIVAGSIQDNKRGVIIGSTTFGKASVQSVIPLTDGSGLRLTTAKYYTPSGKVIHEKGIQPDIQVAVLPENEAKIMMQEEEVYAKGEKPKKAETQPAVEDVVLNRSIEIFKIQDILQAK